MKKNSKLHNILSVVVGSAPSLRGRAGGEAVLSFFLLLSTLFLQSCLKDQEDTFDDLAAELENYGVEFTYAFDADHDRFIKLDNGWKILLSRGLDIFDKYSRFSMSNKRQENRRCREFSVTFIQE